jgi:hypothetical protein
MNDYIVLVEQDLAKPRLARFVDTTSEKERRPVVDVFFAKKDEVLSLGGNTILRSTSLRKAHRFWMSDGRLSSTRIGV